MMPPISHYTVCLSFLISKTWHVVLYITISIFYLFKTSILYIVIVAAIDENTAAVLNSMS